MEHNLMETEEGPAQSVEDLCDRHTLSEVAYIPPPTTTLGTMLATNVEAMQQHKHPTTATSPTLPLIRRSRAAACLWDEMRAFFHPQRIHLPQWEHLGWTNEGWWEADENTCAICTEAFLPGAIVATMPCCSQPLHETCWEQWMRQSNLCALCRLPIYSLEGLIKSVCDFLTPEKTQADDSLEEWLTRARMLLRVVDPRWPGYVRVPAAKLQRFLERIHYACFCDLRLDAHIEDTPAPRVLPGPEDMEEIRELLHEEPPWHDGDDAAMALLDSIVHSEQWVQSTHALSLLLLSTWTTEATCKILGDIIPSQMTGGNPHSGADLSFKELPLAAFPISPLAQSKWARGLWPVQLARIPTSEKTEVHTQILCGITTGVNMHIGKKNQVGLGWLRGAEGNNCSNVREGSARGAGFYKDPEEIAKRSEIISQLRASPHPPEWLMTCLSPPHPRTQQLLQISRKTPRVCVFTGVDRPCCPICSTGNFPRAVADEISYAVYRDQQSDVNLFKAAVQIPCCGTLCHTSCWEANELRNYNCCPFCHSMLITAVDLSHEFTSWFSTPVKDLQEKSDKDVSFLAQPELWCQLRVDTASLIMGQTKSAQLRCFLHGAMRILRALGNIQEPMKRMMGLPPPDFMHACKNMEESGLLCFNIAEIIIQERDPDPLLECSLLCALQKGSWTSVYIVFMRFISTLAMRCAIDIVGPKGVLFSTPRSAWRLRVVQSPPDVD